jgi:hypothetical protein
MLLISQTGNGTNKFMNQYLLRLDHVIFPASGGDLISTYSAARDEF